MAATRQTSRPAMSPGVPVDSVSPSVPYRAKATNVPSMKLSPWAKLISSMIP